MARLVIGIFPDRETADHAASLLERGGMQVIRESVEQFGDPAYYRDHLPQGSAAIVVVRPLEREAEARSIMMHAGALQLQGHGSEGRPTGMTDVVEVETPVPVSHGERAPESAAEGDAGTVRRDAGAISGSDRDGRTADRASGADLRR
jgi:hypothetical protein